MVCNLTSTNRPRRHDTGSALLEAVMAIGITGLLVLTLCGVSLFSGRSFAALFNYVDLDDCNRLAMDQLTRDVRECNRVKSYTTNGLTLEDSDGFDLSYNYSASGRTLTRVKAGTSSVLLHDCELFSFSLGQRNVVGGTYDVYPVAAAASDAKLVNASWKCSRTIFGQKQNTENVQTARIVIRKQGT